MPNRGETSEPRVVNIPDLFAKLCTHTGVFEYSPAENLVHNAYFAGSPRGWKKICVQRCLSAEIKTSDVDKYIGERRENTLLYRCFFTRWILKLRFLAYLIYRQLHFCLIQFLLLLSARTRAHEECNFSCFIYFLEACIFTDAVSNEFSLLLLGV